MSATEDFGLTQLEYSCLIALSYDSPGDRKEETWVREQVGGHIDEVRQALSRLAAMRLARADCSSGFANWRINILGVRHLLDCGLSTDVGLNMFENIHYVDGD